MTTVQRVENQIRRREGFRVKILYHNGYRDVRSDRHGMRAYPFEKAAKGNMRVGAWIRRFSRQYPGLAVEVLKAKGGVADGRMNIGTVREGYK